jgi:membrane associated rhomboid family serine protease
MSNYSPQVRFGPAFTPIVKLLVIINAVVFLLQTITQLSGFTFLIDFFALNPAKVNQFHIYQLLTYAFLHGDFFHILFNMLTLWMFGSELESYWGRKNFLIFFLLGAISGGVLTWGVNFFWKQGIVVGASAGVFAVLIAYALIWPNREVLFMLIFPIKIKYVVFLIMVPMMFLYSGGNIAHMAHLGGGLFGFGYWFANKKFRFDFEKFLDWDDYIRRKKFKMYQEEMESRSKAIDRVDELLEKISKHGYNSLSSKEKKFLNEASNKYYKDKEN